MCPFKSLLLSLLFFTLSLKTLQAQASGSHKVQVLQSSITIIGSTNVNQFSCKLVQDNPGKKWRITRHYNSGLLTFDHLRLTYPVAQFNCGIKAMNSDLQDLLQAEAFPQLQFTIQSIDIQDMGSTMEQVKVATRVVIEIAGQRKETLIQNSHVLNYSDVQMELTGHQEFLISDFNLEPPTKMFGMVKVRNRIKIEYQIHLLALPI